MPWPPDEDPWALVDDPWETQDETTATDLSDPGSLAALVTEQANYIVGVGTGGLKIQDVDRAYKLNDLRLRREFDALGLKPPFPWRGLWEWHAFYGRKLPTYSDRRAHISELETAALDALEATTAAGARQAELEKEEVTKPSIAKPEPQLVKIGEGAFANVYRYFDEEYNIDVAVKTAKRDLDAKELIRFRQEFDILKSLKFPYIVQAYTFDEANSKYSMEYCDTTLNDYIASNNAKLPWGNRKRIALQLLYGLNYLHRKEVMHRDISRKNVLLKVYDEGAVQVKLSDFGLAKAAGSDFTALDSVPKGTHIDPMLVNLKEYVAVNDIYATGHVLAFIFTGQTQLGAVQGPIRAIINKCTHNEVEERYQSMTELIAAVDALDPPSAEEDERGSVAPA